MINVLLDPLPTTWTAKDGKEYGLDTDFRIGIQLCLLQEDEELSQTEKAILTCQLLFTDEIPPEEEAQECITYFLSGWNHDKESIKKVRGRLMDFDVDQWRIYSAFRQQYNINLSVAEMHWWEFMGLLSALTECTYTRVIDIRQKEFKPKMDKEERKALEEAKAVYTLDTPMTAEEREIEANLFDFLGGKKSTAEKKRIEEFEKYAE